MFSDCFSAVCCVVIFGCFIFNFIIQYLWFHGMNRQKMRRRRRKRVKPGGGPRHYKMDNQKRQMLQAFQKDIVRDLDVKYIMDDLFARNVMPSDVYDQLLSNIANRTDCTRYLLDWLIQYGDNSSFDGFVDSLSKDYRWLWEKLSIEDVGGEREPLSESVEDTLSRGDVPRLPRHYVSRSEQERNVATRLEHLKRHEVVVLHGMSGSGKSCVATAALRNNRSLLHEHLGTAVYWLNLATCRTEDDIRTQQLLLYRKASAALSPRDNSMFSSTMSMSSLSSTFDSQSVASVDNSWKDYRDLLRSLFAEPPLKEGLLVLDDVMERSVAEAFDIGCKLLVTTRDVSVVATLQPIVVKVESGFTESESLELFAGCAGVRPEQLPRQARKIHALCRGGLFQISLLGANIAENRERLLHDPAHWNYYVDNLTHKDFLSLIHMRRSDQQVDPIKPVQMCINSLPPDIRALFKKLAVLPDNVKVSARTLSTLWGLSEPKVDGIMRQLRIKALVEQHYVQEKKDYLYEVHEVILSCVRAMHSAEERRRLHAELLARYGFLDVTARAPPRLADDGYIAFYLAHHIYHTENTNNEWSLFNKLFLDLEFVGEKVRLAGQADTVGDLTVYQDKICRNDMDNNLVEELRSWLGAHGGDLHRFPRTNIVQSVLQHCSGGALYARAHALATRSAAAHRLYFSFLHEQDVEKDKCSIMDVGEAVTSVCFLGQYMLAGLNSGNIKVYNTHTYRMCKELTGGGSAVVWVGACPINANRVSSLDAAGALHVWCIDRLEPHSPEDPADGDAEDPDENALDCDDKEVRIVSEHGPFLNCRWANNRELLVVHTATAVLAYTADGADVTRFPLASARNETERRIVCCAFSANDTTLLVAWALADTHHLDVYDCKSKERLLTFAHSNPILQILNIPNNSNRVLVVCSNEVVEHTWQWSKPALQRTGKTQTIIKCGDIRAGIRFLSGAVSVGGTLLFVATDDARVVCVDLATRAHILDLFNRRGNVVSMDVSELWFDEFESHYDVLGTGDEENSVKVWHLDTAYIAQASNQHRKARLTSKFACSFSCASTSPASGRSSPRTPAHAPLAPRRTNSAAPCDLPCRPLKPTNSLSERRSLKLNLNGISNCSDEDVLQPMLAVIDDKNNIQIMRGRRVFAEISEAPEDTITAVQISPCNRYVIFGVKSGAVKKFVLRSKETLIICDINSAVVYLEFVTPQLLIVSGKNRCVMAYRAVQGEHEWKLTMLLHGNTRLGSQEILNDISGNKKKPTDTCSNSSDGSATSTKPRVFASERTGMGNASSLVLCCWLERHGLLTVQDNATVKLWDREMQLAAVLNGRQDVTVTCASCQESTLAICDELGKFQTFRLHAVGADAGEAHLQLNTLQEVKLNNRITACAVSRAGRLLAVGLDNGNIVLWNIQAKYQIKLLKHHKSGVTALLFSPEPASAAPGGLSPAPGGSHDASLEDGEAAPLVLASAAAEVLWWNVTHVIHAKRRDSKPRSSRSMLTPISPNDKRNSGSFGLENLHIDPNSNHFFGNGSACPRDQWESLWKGKRSDTAPRELLACVKLAGVSARRLLADDTFSCFVTVDSSGAPHLMNLLRAS